MKYIFFIILSLLLCRCKTPAHVFLNKEEAQVILVFEKQCLDSLSCYYFLKSSNILLDNKKYTMIGWRTDELPEDSVFREEIISKFSQETYDKIVNPIINDPLLIGISTLDTLPYCYRNVAHPHVENDLRFITYRVQGTFFILKRINPKFLIRYRDQHNCPIQKPRIETPLCIMAQGDTVYAPSPIFLNKHRLIQSTFHKSWINYCD
jgi:hypothetical protein